MNKLWEAKIEQFHQVFERNPIPFAVYHLHRDQAGNYSSYEVAYMNQACLNMLDMQEEDIIGKTITRFSEGKLKFLVEANEGEHKLHQIQYDVRCEKYLDIYAYSEMEDYVAFVLSDITEQIHQQQAAKAERDKYSHLLDAVPDGIAVFEIKRGKYASIHYFNDEISKMTGYSREEIQERGQKKLCEAVAEDWQRVDKRAREVIADGTPSEIEYRSLRKNGELRWLRARLSMEYVDEETVHAYVAYTDITMQKQAEFAIATETAYQASAQDINLLAKCRVNISKNLIEKYDQKDNLTTISENDCYTDSVQYIAGCCATEDMARELKRKIMPEALTSAYGNGIHEVSVEYLRTMEDGSVLWVITKIKLYSHPETQDIMGFVYTYDIDREKTMKLIVDHVTDTEFDMMGLLYVANDMIHCVRASSMEEMISCSADVKYSEGIRKYTEHFVAEDLRAEFQKRMCLASVMTELEERQVYTLSYPVQFQNQEHHKKWDFSYLDDSHGVIIMTRSDVTEILEEQVRQREILRNALIQAEQASHAKTDFLSHMSHEIRTPMNAIIGMSTLAAQCVNDPQQVADCISKVGISARFLLSLINDILDMSRIESGKVNLKEERFPFEELINNINTIIYNQARSKGIDYDCTVTSFVGTHYIGDATKLQQVLINILGNAIKFTPPGGKTQFIIHQNRVEHGVAHMSFTINDTGIGISEAFQKRMFDPFEQADDGNTAHYQGTGLGLAICKNLVNMMNGTIQVNSIEGVGSEFTVNVPLGVCEEEHPYRLPKNIPFDELHALVVDDDVLICENTQSILREMGMNAEWVSSGIQAVSLVNKWKNRNAYFDIVLLDWKMPDMDGLETARHIRAAVGPDVTIIIISAYDWSEIEQEAKAAGVNMLITKPVFKSTLLSAFQHIYTEKTEKEEEHHEKEYDFTGRRVLLVEDHILNVEVAKRLMEVKHMEVEVAENGLRSIEMFAKAPDDYYDAILMDIRMPVMDGLTAARSIRQLSNTSAKTIPIIAMSANAFDEDVEKSRAAGMNAHLAKPIEPELLYVTLEKYFQ